MLSTTWAEELAIPNHQDAARDTARKWLALNPIVIDTETTGVGPDDEVVELAAFSATGAALLDTLVYSNKSIPVEVSAMHGITDADTIESQTIVGAFKELTEVCKGSLVLSYNYDFDSRLLDQSLKRMGETYARAYDEWAATLPGTGCIMLLYAQYHGEPSDRFAGEYRWQRLEDAMSHFGIEYEGPQHRALTDAKAALRVLQHMAVI